MSYRLTAAEVIARNERVARGKGHTVNPKTGEPLAEVGKGGLHEKIIEWCASQWPRWKYRHARTDRKTTEELGVEDFTLFAPNGITLHIECKAQSGKQTTEQLGWQFELGRLGHKVHVIYSMEQFLELVEPLKTPPEISPKRG